MTKHIFLKKYYKLILVILVLVTASCLLVVLHKKHNLEDGTMQDWQTASLEKRDATVELLLTSDSDAKVIRNCVDKIAILPDANNLEVKDAVKLCNIGLLLKKHI